MEERITELLTLTSFDGLALEGKLDLPARGRSDRLVVFVNGSGPNTYDDRRDKGDGTQFNFHDLFAKELTDRGVAFFRHSCRGCTPGETPPFYCDIDEEAYQTYCPDTSARDLEDWIAALLARPGLAGARVILWGWSEGTKIAPLVARRGKVEPAGLVLCGYADGTMEEALDWQQSGNSDLIVFRQWFDTDGDGVVSRAEFEAGPEALLAYLGEPFEAFDINGDGVLDLSDFAARNTENRAAVFRAIETGDDDWFREHFPVRLTTRWFYAHRALPPNRETLHLLDLPIHIFQGEQDASTRVEDTYAVRDRFAALGRENLVVHLYPGMGHNLNYEQFLADGVVPQSLLDVFQVCRVL